MATAPMNLVHCLRHHIVCKIRLRTAAMLPAGLLQQMEAEATAAGGPSHARPAESVAQALAALTGGKHDSLRGEDTVTLAIADRSEGVPSRFFFSLFFFFIFPFFSFFHFSCFHFLKMFFCFGQFFRFLFFSFTFFLLLHFFIFFVFSVFSFIVEFDRFFTSSFFSCFFPFFCFSFFRVFCIPLLPSRPLLLPPSPIRAPKRRFFYNNLNIKARFWVREEERKKGRKEERKKGKKGKEWKELKGREGKGGTGRKGERGKGRRTRRPKHVPFRNRTHRNFLLFACVGTLSPTCSGPGADRLLAEKPLTNNASYGTRGLPSGRRNPQAQHSSAPFHWPAVEAMRRLLLSRWRVWV